MAVEREAGAPGQESQGHVLGPHLGADSLAPVGSPGPQFPTCKERVHRKCLSRVVVRFKWDAVCGALAGGQARGKPFHNVGWHYCQVLAHEISNRQLVSGKGIQCVRKSQTCTGGVRWGTFLGAECRGVPKTLIIKIDSIFMQCFKKLKLCKRPMINKVSIILNKNSLLSFPTLHCCARG